MLSLARMKAVMYWLAERGIERERLVAKSWGHWMPLVDDSWCLAPEERLSANCNRMKTNRRIVVTIRRRGPPPPFAILAGDPSTAPILPTSPPRVIEPFFKLCRAFNAKDKPAIDCVLPMAKKVLTTTTVLQRVEESGARLPAATENTLPSSGALLPWSKDPSSRRATVMRASSLLVDDTYRQPLGRRERRPHGGCA